MALAVDRRNRPRVALHWPVRLIRQPDTQPVETTTENLSSDGLYCITNAPFKPGERLQCEIFIFGEALGFSESSVRLQCHVTVSRVENLSVIGAFGLGCHIEDYAVASGSPLSNM